LLGHQSVSQLKDDEQFASGLGDLVIELHLRHAWSPQGPVSAREFPEALLFHADLRGKALQDMRVW
jgi:hypothetical protein